MSFQRDSGALTDRRLIGAMDSGFIKHMMQSDTAPASQDLTLSSEIYEVQRNIFPYSDRTVEEMIELMGGVIHSIEKPLRKGKKYLIKLQQALAFPSIYRGLCNPKSSIGRLDVHARVIVDRVSRYDTVPAGYQGEVWVLVESKSFAIAVYEGMPIVQLRILVGECSFREHDLVQEMSASHLLFDVNDTEIRYDDLDHHDADGTILFSLMIPESGVVGYRCIADAEQVLDLSKAMLGKYDPRDFFKRVETVGGLVHLRKGRFYILSSAESLRLPPHLAGEMVAIDDRCGEFRSHYAGFFDPGWGYGKESKGTGRPITLEVRPFEDLVVRTGQPVGKVRFQRMIELPMKHYDQRSSNYLKQTGPQLAKWFAPWE